jgi:hypothetical protein
MAVNRICGSHSDIRRMKCAMWERVQRKTEEKFISITTVLENENFKSYILN